VFLLINQMMLARYTAQSRKMFVPTFVVICGHAKPIFIDFIPTFMDKR